MPRTARKKSLYGIFHIIIRSISEVDLFKENKDKEMYISLIKEYQQIYRFKIYSYCFMTNHAHFIIDANGADISSIMHGLNFKYARKFNIKYNRHGHLFQDRFKSKLILSYEYLINLSAYIHNNPIDIRKYHDCPEKYKYSSLSVYLGLQEDKFGILDEDFVMQLFGEDPAEARKKYIEFVFSSNEEKIKDYVEFKNEKTKYFSCRHIIARNFDSNDVINFVSKETGIDRIFFHIKNNRKTIKVRAIAILLLRGFCNLKCKEICKILGNISQSRVSKLCSIALDIIQKEERYKNIVNKFVLQCI